jgi:hypothetical protein
MILHASPNAKFGIIREMAGRAGNRLDIKSCAGSQGFQEAAITVGSRRNRRAKSAKNAIKPTSIKY